MIVITILTHFWSQKKMFRQRQLRPIRGERWIKKWEWFLDFMSANHCCHGLLHNPKIDYYSLFTDECLIVDSLSAHTKCHEIICGLHIMLVCITLLLIIFPIWSIQSRSNHQITNRGVLWSFQLETNCNFWSSAARGTTMEQFEWGRRIVGVSFNVCFI